MTKTVAGETMGAQPAEGFDPEAFRHVVPGSAARVAVAVDGSTSADLALSLVASVAWPAGTRIRLIGALDDLPRLLGPALPALDRQDVVGVEQALTRAVQRTLDEAGATMAQPRVDVTQAFVRGAPAVAVVAEARRFGADLIVAGSRDTLSGRRTLGSVGSVIVEHAPMSVLIVRRPRITSAIVAVDATESTPLVVERILCDPFFAGASLHVLSVCELPEPWRSQPFLPLIYSGTMKSYASILERARGPYRDAAMAACQRLQDAGFKADWERRDGSAANNLTEAGLDRHADVIVVGAKSPASQSPVALGATTRSVLLHADASVFVVRR